MQGSYKILCTFERSGRRMMMMDDDVSKAHELEVEEKIGCSGKM